MKSFTFSLAHRYFVWSTSAPSEERCQCTREESNIYMIVFRQIVEKAPLQSELRGWCSGVFRCKLRLKRLWLQPVLTSNTWRQTSPEDYTIKEGKYSTQGLLMVPDLCRWNRITQRYFSFPPSSFSQTLCSSSHALSVTSLYKRPKCFPATWPFGLMQRYRDDRTRVAGEKWGSGKPYRTLLGFPEFAFS